ncbi:MAG: hypothetical protein ABEJ70_02890 [Halobacteriaceae archaeon]
MSQFTQRGDRDAIVRQYDYGDSVVVVADVGARDEDVSVDVVDGTAIVVVETGTGSIEREFDLPDGDAKAFINNGVVTVEVQG